MGGHPIESSTFSLNADDFVAMDITFKNTHNLEPGKPHTWAPAALINADKASFYRCGFVSMQDTLTDSEGRHYFEKCYIEGVADFIWGNGRSIYLECMINVTASPGGMAGYITAQARASAADNTGFVFKRSLIFGTGPAHLGPEYYFTAQRCLIQLFRRVGRHGIMSEKIYAEVVCIGAGADKSKHVAWEKNLSKELSYLLNPNTFINQGGWIQRQLKAKMVP